MSPSECHLFQGNSSNGELPYRLMHNWFQKKTPFFSIAWYRCLQFSLRYLFSFSLSAMEVASSCLKLAGRQRIYFMYLTRQITYDSQEEKYQSGGEQVGAMGTG